MKEVDKRKTPNTKNTKRTERTERRDNKPNQGNDSKTLNGKEIESKDSYAKTDPSMLVSDSNTGTELSEVNENLVIHYVDDVNRFEEVPQDMKATPMTSKENMDDEVSDCETIKDSVSSQGDSPTLEDEKVERASWVPKSIAKKNFSKSFYGSRERSGSESIKSKSKGLHNTAKKVTNSNNGPSGVKTRTSSRKKVLLIAKFPLNLPQNQLRRLMMSLLKR
ncbi:hypothetical protein TB1_013452 [Malus domestica]